MDRIKIDSIKEGQVFWSLECGINYRLTAVTDARHFENKDGRYRPGWFIECRLDSGKEITIGEHDDCGAYGLRLYDSPLDYA